MLKISESCKVQKYTLFRGKLHNFSIIFKMWHVGSHKVLLINAILSYSRPLYMFILYSYFRLKLLNGPAQKSTMFLVFQCHFYENTLIIFNVLHRLLIPELLKDSFTPKYDFILCPLLKVTCARKIILLLHT